MIRAYKYRFYPSNGQEILLDQNLRLCCSLYNAALEQRRYAHKAGRPINYRIQQDQLPELKRGMPEYAKVHSQVLQDVLRRIDRAFTSFYERVRRRRRGESAKPGYPRFKPEWRYNSITYSQAESYNIINGHVLLPKIGKLRVFMHREPVGLVKTMTVKRDHVGDWYIVLTTELPDVLRKTPTLAIGIDVGLTKLVQVSNGEFVECRKFSKSEKKMKRTQRQLARKVKGSLNRQKSRLKLAKIHRKIQRQREYFLHKVSKQLVSKADLLVFEDLQIQNLMANHRLAKSIGNASWRKLYQYVSYKASSAGKTATRVDPRGTTCDCACGAKVKLLLSERTFHCTKCGLTTDRDLHGSFGTLRKVGWEAAEQTPVEMRPLLVEKPASLVKEAGSPRH